MAARQMEYQISITLELMLLLNPFSSPTWNAMPFLNGSSSVCWVISRRSRNKISKEMLLIAMKRLVAFSPPSCLSLRRNVALLPPPPPSSPSISTFVAHLSCLSLSSSSISPSPSIALQSLALVATVLDSLTLPCSSAGFHHFLRPSELRRPSAHSIKSARSKARFSNWSGRIVCEAAENAAIVTRTKTKMAARQMEEIQRKLSNLNYPRANAPAQSLLFAGMERYALLEWLFFRLLGDKSPFSQQNIQGDAVDRDEETGRIQYLAEIAKFLGITTTIDTEVIQGRGSYEERTEMIRLIVDLVEASIYADNPDWSVDEQVAKDIQLIDSIAEKQAQIFSEECKLFPADVQIQSIYPLPDVSELETKLAEQSKILLNLQQKVDDLASKHAYNPDEEYTEVESQLRAHLESFLETARSFNIIYTKEIRPWTHMMEVPQLHGFGPAANRLLEAYNMLLKFLGNLRNLRDSHAALAIGSSETIAGEPSSVTRIISECESALTFINRDLGVLSASIAREHGQQGEEATL